jgi:lipopolysaccharide export system permease protein
MWFSTFVLVPIGLFLIYKAMRDSQLLNKEFYFRFWKNVRTLWEQKAAQRKLKRTFAKEQQGV